LRVLPVFAWRAPSSAACAVCVSSADIFCRVLLRLCLPVSWHFVAGVLPYLQHAGGLVYGGSAAAGVRRRSGPLHVWTLRPAWAAGLLLGGMLRLPTFGTRPFCHSALPGSASPVQNRAIPSPGSAEIDVAGPAIVPAPLSPGTFVAGRAGLGAARQRVSSLGSFYSAGSGAAWTTIFDFRRRCAKNAERGGCLLPLSGDFPDIPYRYAWTQEDGMLKSSSACAVLRVRALRRAAGRLGVLPRRLD